MISIVGAGPGAPDLITVRGAGRLRTADTVIYAGSLVNPAILGLCGDNSSIYNSAELTLEEVMEIMRRDHGAGREITEPAGRLSGCIPEIRAFSGRSVSRSIF